DVDKPRAVSASLMQPSIDRETRFTPSSSSEFFYLGAFDRLEMSQVFSKGFGKVGFLESEFVSNSTEPRVRVGVDMFFGLSELSSGRTLFSSRSAGLRMSTSWTVVFGLSE